MRPVQASRPIRLERRLQASPERVYRAWADPDTLTGWFAHRVEGALAVGTRSVLVWPARRMAVDVLEADPVRRFRFRWTTLPHDPFPSDVVVTISPRGLGSTLVLEAGAWDLSLVGALEDHLEALEGWVEALAALRAHLDYAVDLRIPD
jgi:uncharacterized protein YndB with AHSA1/START domain